MRSFSLSLEAVVLSQSEASVVSTGLKAVVLSAYADLSLKTIQSQPYIMGLDVEVS